MDAFHEQDGTSALPITTGMIGSNIEQFPVESLVGQVLQPRPGLGGRQMYSKEQWEAQKPVIRQIYNVENRPCNYVIDILRTEHSFFPTRRQFYRRISEWGFEKNIKDKEMRSIVRNLNQEKKDDQEFPVELRGQQVDLVKIKRWRNKQRRTEDVAHPFISNYSVGKCSRFSDISFVRSNKAFLAALSSRILSKTDKCGSPIETARCSALNPSTEVTESSQIRDSISEGLSHWSWVDVPGSPMLSRFFEALGIECHSTIPSIDLNSCNPNGALFSTSETEPVMEVNEDINAKEYIDFNRSVSSEELARYSQEVFQNSDMFLTDSNPNLAEPSFSEGSFREWDFFRGQPLKISISHIQGISPFPAPIETSRTAAFGHRNFSPHAQSQSLQVKEIECKCRLRKFKNTLGVENPETLIAMKELGDIYYKQDKQKRAERLYRRITISYQRIFGLKHVNTLSAYLDVVDVIHYQGDLRQALEIHQRVQDTIIKLIDQSHQLALHTNFIRTDRLYRFGQLDEADRLSRQTSQIGLCTRGPRHGRILCNMRALAEILRHCGKLVESEQLLQINLQMFRELGDSFSKSFHISLQSLAGVLYDQSCAGTSGNSAQPLQDCYLRKEARKQGDLLESGCQLRIVLQRQIKGFGEKDPDTYVYLDELSRVLGDMGRHFEATELLERRHKGLVEIYGVNNSETLSCCRELEDNYEKLGRYEGGVALLQQNIDDARRLGERLTQPLLETVLKLARLLRETGRYREAVAYYEECLKGFAETLGLVHQRTLHVCDDLGLCYEELRCCDDALHFYQRTFEQISPVGGDEHPALGMISRWITELVESIREPFGKQDKRDVAQVSNNKEAFIEEGNACEYNA